MAARGQSSSFDKSSGQSNRSRAPIFCLSPKTVFGLKLLAPFPVASSRLEAQGNFIMYLRGAGRAGLALRRSLATHASSSLEKDCSTITPRYEALMDTLQRVRKYLNRPLTLAEKVLYSHVISPEKAFASGGRIRGETYLQLRPERVAMQDASAQ